MSIYIGNDLEDRLKALEIENASLKKYMNLINLFQEFIRPPAKKSNLYLQRNFERTRFQMIQI